MGKYVLSGLGILSLIWIGYVGATLLSSNEPLLPAAVFGKADQTVVIVHKPLEVDYNEDAFHFLSTTPFYANILTHTERVQHFYFSASRNVVLLERSKPWTIELIDRYFQAMDIRATFTSAKEMQLSNGWNARYDKEELLVFKGTIALQDADDALEWNYVDRKSSATRVTFDTGKPVFENVYLGANGQLEYIAQLQSEGKHLADDQDIFQDVIPSNFREYFFYEKNYLKTLSEVASPLLEWTKQGVAVVLTNGKQCIITDQIAGQDPIAILGNSVEEASISEDKNSGHVLNVSLPKALLDNDVRNWYIEVFNGRVFIAADKQTIDRVIGDYELGATLSQQEARRFSLFGKVPRNVSYRHLSPEEHRTISLLPQSRHTVVQKFGGKAPVKDEETDEQTNDSAYPPIRIDGGIEQIIPVQGDDFLFVLSKKNVLYGIRGNAEKWKAELDGFLVDKPMLAMTGNELIVTTAGSVHLFQTSGQEAAGFPVQCAAQPVTSALLYSWRGKTQLAVLDETQLTIYAANGQKNTTIKINTPQRNAPFMIWANAGELTATILSKDKATNYSIDRKRKRLEFALPEAERVLIKTEGQPFIFYQDNGGLTKVSATGKKTVVATRVAGTILGAEKSGDQTLILVRYGKNLRTYTENGQLQSIVAPDFQQIGSASVQRSGSGKSFITILDGLANNNYIYDLSGKLLMERSFEGAGPSVLHRQRNGSIVLVSQSNGYLVRYPVQ